MDFLLNKTCKMKICILAGTTKEEIQTEELMKLFSVFAYHVREFKRKLNYKITLSSVSLQNLVM